ncbi:hypothetical protein DTO96_102328 [Ephemeroptericola cinctiostellae]|uniref:Lipoprotein n=1 Tax=Ephemeroptericola cinctiostellae TaxID=2268024 RepID=A0A345DDY5_9BURK|nr:hypothetical protein [Ephemeroptericola cinctiostellae]AXF86573.1 hypothetical protein DTO96_102328 [Ephemeroptericola cinctiostellae]
MRQRATALTLMGLALGLVLVGLSACTGKPVASADPALPELVGSLEEVRAWTTQVRADAQAQIGQAQVDEDSRLLSVSLSAPAGAVFLAQKPEKTALKNVKVVVDGMVKEWVNAFGNVGANQNTQTASAVNYGRDVLSAPQSIAPPKVLDVSQVGLDGFRYAGLLTQDEASLGLIKIEDRLYRVHVGDEIGQGRWRVVALNAQTMQLQVAGKVKRYDRN